jgi:hypothetical protein
VTELKIEQLVAKEVDRTKLRYAALKVSRAGFNLLQPYWVDGIRSSYRKQQK